MAGRLNDCFDPPKITPEPTPETALAGRFSWAVEGVSKRSWEADPNAEMA